MREGGWEYTKSGIWERVERITKIAKKRLNEDEELISWFNTKKMRKSGIKGGRGGGGREKEAIRMKKIG